MKAKKAGRSSGGDASFNRRLLRSMPADAFSRRLLRSAAPDAFSRRLLKRSAAGRQDSFARRLLRSPAAGQSPSAAFNRRLLRADPSAMHQLQARTVPDAFKRRLLKKSAAAEPAMMKRQSLIPFPRTGKRSDPEVAPPVLQEMEGLEPEEGGQHQLAAAFLPMDDMIVDFVDEGEDYNDTREEDEQDE